MTKHFVTFYSPGTFVHEESTKPIESWGIAEAVKMSRGIVERYNSGPFGFRFSTRERGEDDLDSKVAKRSPMYYLGGVVRTFEQVVKDARDGEAILRANMSCNGYNRIVTTETPYRNTSPLNDDDVVLDLREFAPIHNGDNQPEEKLAT